MNRVVLDIPLGVAFFLAIDLTARPLRRRRSPSGRRHD
jgi:hypothetical protein